MVYMDQGLGRGEGGKFGGILQHGEYVWRDFKWREGEDWESSNIKHNQFIQFKNGSLKNILINQGYLEN